MAFFYSKNTSLLVLVVLLLLAHQTHQQEPNCGRSRKSSRIVGGSVVTPNEFPWMAYLSIKFWSNDAATCGGTLISENSILTAAHCLYGAVSVEVTLGAHDVSLVDGSSRQFFNLTSRNFEPHPNFRFGEAENDIAILRLPTNAVLNDYVQTACLPFASDSDQVNDNVTVIGWGNFSSIDNSGLSPVLRKMDTTVISSFGTNGQCQQTAGLGSFSGDKVICSDGSRQRRYCYGDDGGPMNYYNAVWGRWFVIGVASLGDSTTNCQTINKPNIYARVRGYLNWIGEITDLKPIFTTTTTTTTTTSTTTRPTTQDPSYFDCTGKPDGNYPNPAFTCSTTFYMCSNGTPYLFECAQAGTVYRREISACDWPSNVAECK